MHSLEGETGAARQSMVLLAYPFRPFFLLTALYAAAVMVGWLGFLLLGWPITGELAPRKWHAHEMLFGVVPAAVAGFLLTAMCNWTGARPLNGAGLAGLAALWLSGRVAMWSSSWLPAGLVAAVDLSFLPVAAVYAGRVIIGAGNYRNLMIVLILALMGLANVLNHLGMWAAEPGWARQAEHFVVALIVLMMVVIGGRITPAFTGNWLARRGEDRGRVRSWPLVNRLAIGSTALLIPLPWLGLDPAWHAMVALSAGLANGARLVGWSGWLSRSDPLVWILHLGYAWIVIGLLLQAASFVWAAVPETAWLHAIGVGAMGTLILGVMTRVSLGHTGRALVLPKFAVLCYWAITAAVLLRLASAFGGLDYRWGLGLAGGAWILAFALFLVSYWPILSSPRADGRPG